MAAGSNLSHLAIVCDPDFGTRLYELVKSREMWVVKSECNRSAAKQIWGNDTEEDYHRYGVTTFVVLERESAEDMFLRILPTVDEHHNEKCKAPTWTRLLVIGVPQSSRVKDALEGYGACNIRQVKGGFECERNAQDSA